MAHEARIVVVGLGSIGRRHARLLAKRGDLEVEWCEPCDQALALAQDELGRDFTAFRSFEAMLESRPSMVVIATPHAEHSPQTIESLKAGVHVLCEKPMSDSLSKAELMAKAADDSGCVLTIGFHLHFHPALQRIKNLVDAGELGSIHYLHCRVGSYQTLVNSRSRYQAAMKGAIFMDYAHQPDLFYWLLKEKPKGVYASGGKGGALEYQSNPNFVSVLCDYQDPCIATIHLNYLQAPERHEYEVVGDKGWIVLDMNSGLLCLGHPGDAKIREERFSTERDPLYEAEHDAFIAAVKGERSAESPPSEALVSMQVIDAAMQSWQRAERIDLS